MGAANVQRHLTSSRRCSACSAFPLSTSKNARMTVHREILARRSPRMCAHAGVAEIQSRPLATTGRPGSRLQAGGARHQRPDRGTSPGPGRSASVRRRDVPVLRKDASSGDQLWEHGPARPFLLAALNKMPASPRRAPEAGGPLARCTMRRPSPGRHRRECPTRHTGSRQGCSREWRPSPIPASRSQNRCWEPHDLIAYAEAEPMVGESDNTGKTASPAVSISSSPERTC